MKQLRYIDFDCPECESTHTRFVYFDTETHAPVDQEVCARVRGYISGTGINYKTLDMVTHNEEIICDGVLAAREMSGVGYMKTINKNNSDFNERERARLEKRQDDHWRRQGLDEAVDRDRAHAKKHGIDPGFK